MEKISTNQILKRCNISRATFNQQYRDNLERIASTTNKIYYSIGSVDAFHAEYQISKKKRGPKPKLKNEG